MRIRACTMIRLAVKPPPPVLPLYVVARTGGELAGARVVIARPDPCIVTPSTKIDFVDRVDYEIEELKHNVKLVVKYGSGRSTLIYPKKTWNEVTKRLLEPLSSGRAPKEQGAVLLGPPGTGKTSMMEALGDILGLGTVKVTPEKVLSKWLGESEKKIASLFSQVESLEPAAMIIDDAEWLVRSRGFAADESTGAYLGMMNILLDRIARWKKEGRLCVAMVASNKTQEFIDSALLRSGRLGRPIFFPLPDFEAAYTYLIEMGVDPKTAEVYAAAAVNAGLSMADIKAVGEALLSGLEPELRPLEGRGYKRFACKPVDSETASWIKRLPGVDELCGTLSSGSSRVAVKIEDVDDEPINAVLVTAIASIACGKAPLIVSDSRYLDEVLATAELCDSPIVVMTRYIPAHDVKRVYAEANQPVVFVGPFEDISRLVHVYRVVIRGGSIESRKRLLMFACRIFGVECREEDCRNAAMGTSERFRAFLRRIAYGRCVAT